MAREYKGSVDTRGDGTIAPMTPHAIKRVTATDNRDVEPLVEAARNIKQQLDDAFARLRRGASDTSVRYQVGVAVRQLQDALAPFEEPRRESR